MSTLAATDDDDHLDPGRPTSDSRIRNASRHANALSPPTVALPTRRPDRHADGSRKNTGRRARSSAPVTERAGPTERAAPTRTSRKTLLTMLGAIPVVSLLGGLAIWYIHETTPPTLADAAPQRAVTPAASSVNPGARSPAAGLSSDPLRPGTRPGLSGPPATDQASPTGAPAQAATTAPDAGRVVGSAPHESGAQASAPGGDRAAGVTPASHRDGVLADLEAAAPVETRRAAPVKPLGWAPGDRLRNPAAANSVPMNRTPDGARGAGQAAATARSDATPAPEGATAPPTSTQPARPTAAAATSFASLGEAQSATCGQTSLLGGLVCKEQVRLSFCKDRWNRHADCQLSGQNREP